MPGAPEGQSLPPPQTRIDASLAPLSDRCEHTFVTSQGSAHGRFQRAIQRGNVLAAETAIRELGGLNLGDALAFVLLLAHADPGRFERAAVRWAGRLALEAPLTTLADAQLALAAMSTAKASPEAAVDVLESLARRARLPVIETTLRALRLNA